MTKNSPERSLALKVILKVMMMPRDTNPHGAIFGGVLLSGIDHAGAVVLDGKERRTVPIRGE